MSDVRINTRIKEKEAMELYYKGVGTATYTNERDREHIHVHCENPQFYASLLRHLVLLQRDTGAQVHLPPEIAEVAQKTGFDVLLDILEPSAM